MPTEAPALRLELNCEALAGESEPPLPADVGLSAQGWGSLPSIGDWPVVIGGNPKANSSSSLSQSSVVKNQM